MLMMAVDIDANNVVLMYVHPDLKIIPVLMPQRQNVAINVITATPLAHQALLLLIPALLVLIMNVAKLVKDVLPLVRQEA